MRYSGIILTVILGLCPSLVILQRTTCPTPCEMGYTCAMVRHGTGQPSPGCISMEEAILLHQALNGGPSGPGTGLNERNMQRPQGFGPPGGGQPGGPPIPGMQFLGSGPNVGQPQLPNNFERRFSSGMGQTGTPQWSQPNSLAFPPATGPMPGMPGMPGMGMPGMQGQGGQTRFIDPTTGQPVFRFNGPSVVEASCIPCSSHLNCEGQTFCSMSTFCGNQLVCQPLQ